MLRYKDNRFHGLGVSFQIPDGFFYNSMPETTAKNKLSLFSPDEIMINIQVEEDREDSKTDLTSFLRSLRMDVEITPISVNGLNGHQANMEPETSEYFEIRFDIGDGVLLSLSMETIKVQRGNLAIDTKAIVEAINPRKEA